MVTLAFIAPKPATIAAEKSDFACRVRAARKALGLSQQALSQQSGIPISTLKNYELGHSSPNAENLQKMHAAGINPMWVLLGHRPVLNRDQSAAMARSVAEKSASKQRAVNSKLKPTAKARISKPLKAGAGVRRPSHGLRTAAPKEDTNNV